MSRRAAVPYDWGRTPRPAWRELAYWRFLLGVAATVALVVYVAIARSGR